jgi:hypothetical protein
MEATSNERLFLMQMMTMAVLVSYCTVIHKFPSTWYYALAESFSALSSQSRKGWGGQIG